MGSANRGGFDIMGKAESAEYDFGLGLKIMMMGNHRNPNDGIGANVNFSGERDTTAAGGCPGGRGNFRVVAADDSDSSSFIKSWGGKMFTASQRQELERQTIIYKYMAASVPVPSELLIPANSKYPSNDHPNVGGKAALDQEPWRCRRTDGKKWRCSRDAAPDQKYCERHSHKTRPSRSRKHVESSASLSSTNPTPRINYNNNNNNNNNCISSSTSSAVNPANFNIKPSFLYQNSPAMFMSQQHSNSRYPYWFMKREAHHGQDSTANSPTASPFFGLDQMTSTSDFMGNDQNHSPLPRQFLDAWSIGDKSDGIGEPDSSLLTLSVARGGAHDGNEEADAQLGMGLFESTGDADMGNDWMCSLAPGGPLAEALCLGIVGEDEVSESADAAACVSNGLRFMK